MDRRLFSLNPTGITEDHADIVSKDKHETQVDLFSQTGCVSYVINLVFSWEVCVCACVELFLFRESIKDLNGNYVY